MDETGLATLPIATTQSRLPPARRYILRVKPAMREVAEAALGFALPEMACTSIATAAWSVLWLGPDEFLLIGQDGAAARQSTPPPPLAGGGWEEGGPPIGPAGPNTPHPIPLPQGEKVSSGARGADAIGPANSLAETLASIPHSLVDVSDRQIAIALGGPRAADVLNAGCPLDLDPSAFPTGMCTRTLLGKVEIVLWRETNDRFRIEVWRSFADYVGDLLALVIAEYQCDPAA